MNVVPFSQSDLNSCLTAIEGTLNFLGYIPGISILSSKARRLYANAQIISGVAFSVMSFAVHLVEKNETALYKNISTGLIYVLHGVLNYFRGSLEQGNIGFLTIPYDFFAWKILPYPDVRPPFDIQKRLFSHYFPGLYAG